MSAFKDVMRALRLASEEEQVCLVLVPTPLPAAGHPRASGGLGWKVHAMIGHYLGDGGTLVLHDEAKAVGRDAEDACGVLLAWLQRHADLAEKLDADFGHSTAVVRRDS